MQPAVKGPHKVDDFGGRRRVPRRSFEAPIGLLIAGVYEMSRCFQVGEGGMMITVARRLEMGRHVVVAFHIPNGSLVMVRGVVRSLLPAKGKTPPRFGIEFINLGFQSKREIRNFVAAATRLDGQLADTNK